VVLGLAGDHALAAPSQRTVRSGLQSLSTQEHSALRVTLVSTAVAAPARYSLCQIRIDETNTTKIFRVGDELMGWRIDQIAKDQVWLGQGAKLEYIERARSGQAPAPTDVRALAQPAPNEGEYIWPHGQ